jgi:hypothetical protein
VPRHCCCYLHHWVSARCSLFRVARQSPRSTQDPHHQRHHRGCRPSHPIFVIQPRTTYCGSHYRRNGRRRSQCHSPCLASRMLQAQESWQECCYTRNIRCNRHLHGRMGQLRAVVPTRYLMVLASTLGIALDIHCHHPRHHVLFSGVATVACSKRSHHRCQTSPCSPRRASRKQRVCSS